MNVNNTTLALIIFGITAVDITNCFASDATLQLAGKWSCRTVDKPISGKIKSFGEGFPIYYPESHYFLETIHVKIFEESYDLGFKAYALAFHIKLEKSGNYSIKDNQITFETLTAREEVLFPLNEDWSKFAKESSELAIGTEVYGIEFESGKFYTLLDTETGADTERCQLLND